MHFFLLEGNSKCDGCAEFAVCISLYSMSVLVIYGSRGRCNVHLSGYRQQYSWNICVNYTESAIGSTPSCPLSLKFSFFLLFRPLKRQNKQFQRCVFLGLCRSKSALQPLHVNPACLRRDCDTYQCVFTRHSDVIKSQLPMSRH